MNLLLDEMCGSAMAHSLRDRGHAALAVVEEPGLRGMNDAELLQVSARSDRVLVTENVSDFVRLHGMFLAEGHRHGGIVIVLANRSPRRGRNLEHLATALDDFLSSPPSGLPESFLWWLT